MLRHRVFGLWLWRFCKFGVFCGVAGLVSCRSAEAGDIYAIDATRSELVVQIFKEGVGSLLAHDHVIRATQYAGRIQGETSNLSTATIFVEVQAASLVVDEPALRSKYQLASTLSEAERREIQETMASAQQLAIAQYPTLLFKSMQIECQNDVDCVVHGALTIRGVTQPVVFPARVDKQDGVIRAQGSLRFTQSSFGYEPYSALLGAVRNRDAALLHFDVTALLLTEGRTTSAVQPRSETR